MTVREKSQSKTRMQGKTSYRARYVELAHQGFRLRAADRVEKWSPAGCSHSGKSSPLIVPLVSRFDGEQRLGRQLIQTGPVAAPGNSRGRHHDSGRRGF